MALDIFKIDGPVKLSGLISVSGSKNAALPIMASTILAPGKSILKGVPNLSDITVLGQLLCSLGCKVERDDTDNLHIDSTVIDNSFGDYEIVRKMRASICILGPLLGRGAAPRLAAGGRAPNAARPAGAADGRAVAGGPPRPQRGRPQDREGPLRLDQGPGAAA